MLMRAITILMAGSGLIEVPAGTFVRLICLEVSVEHCVFWLKIEDVL